jgi:hypothetical protein
MCWHLDAVFLKIHGVTRPPYVTSTAKGVVLKIEIIKTRDHKLALKLLRKPMSCILWQMCRFARYSEEKQHTCQFVGP